MTARIASDGKAKINK
ncbi:hypothetical protein A2U01_0047718, partial [Trifolium medium]|nr:hypothetical protein [Trifolium medium]